MVQPLTDINDVINQPFSLDEIKIAINIFFNTASGVDNVLNEFIKYCHVDCLKLLVDYFNIILDTGMVPTEWCLGIIYPLYKKKVYYLILITIVELLSSVVHVNYSLHV